MSTEMPASSRKRINIEISQDATLAEIQEAINVAVQSHVTRTRATVDNAFSSNMINQYHTDFFVISGYMLPDPKPGNVSNIVNDLRASPPADMTVPGTWLPLIFESGAAGPEGSTGIRDTDLLLVLRERVKQKMIMDAEYVESVLNAFDVILKFHGVDPYVVDKQ